MIAWFGGSWRPWGFDPADVSVWHDGTTPGATSTARLRLRNAALPHWRRFNQADVAVYDLRGDPVRESWVDQVLRHAPGVALSWDGLPTVRRLTQLLAMPGGERLAVAHLANRYGTEGRAVGDALLAGELDLHDVAHRFPGIDLVPNALGLVVHDSTRAGASGPVDGVTLWHVPLPHAATTTVPRRRRGPLRRVVLLADWRANERAAGALGALRADGRARVVLPDSDDFRRLARRHRLEPVVEHADLTTASGRRAALDDADLVLNLLDPRAQDAADAQLEAFDRAVPTLVVRRGWFRTLPESAVVAASPDADDVGRAVRGALGALFGAPAWLAQRAEAGRAILLRDHDPDRCRAALLACLDEVPDLRLRRARHEITTLLDERTRRWLPDAARPWLHERIAPMFGLARTEAQR